ncbi:PAS domain S-box protein, partial [Thermodesulfobacteriota bacterium]
MRRFFSSLVFKISFTILVIETCALTTLGIYYVNRFGNQIDQQVEAKVGIPGTLMNQRTLNYDAVQDRNSMRRLVEEDVVEAVVLRRDGQVFYASNPDQEGRDAETVLTGIEFSILNPSMTENRIRRFTHEGKVYLATTTPLRSDNKLIGYLYLEVDTSHAENEKKALARLFAIGSILCILLTTLSEVVLVHSLTGPRIRKTLQCLKEVKEGNLQSRISINGSQDEIGELGRNVNAMITEIENRTIERDKAEEALRESEEKYRLMFNTMDSGFSLLEMIYDKDGEPADCRYVDVNPTHEKLTGFKKNDIIGRTVRECIPGVEDSWFVNYGRVERTGEPTQIEEYIEGLNGWYKAIAYRPKKGFVAVIFENITDRKQAEKALRESEEFLRTIVENIPDMIFVKDAKELRFVRFNKAGEGLLGYSREELIGKNDYDFFPKEEADFFTEKDRNVLSSGEQLDIPEEPIQTKDKGERILHTKKIPIINEKGKPQYLLGISEDITERKQAEKEKKELEAQLQQALKMEAMGTLAGGIAHDFNNLLMGIQGRTSLMLMDSDSSHSYFEHLKGIEDYVGSAADLTKQLLGFARGGKYEVKPTDLNALIENEDRMFGRTRKEINIQEKFEKNLWTAEVDHRQIEQVLLNIYVNAWQAMPGGGNLYIQTENVIIDEDYIKPYQVEPGKYVKISITDTGVGMDEATQQRIFDPFFTTKAMGRGTGLGLASAYGIIKNHNGFIDVYSEKGEGTTFNIYLPASEKEAVKEKEIDEKLIRGTETVLLVDDEDMIIEVGQGVIEKLGYNVLTAKSGKEAIGIYKKNQGMIGLVVLDMIMPEMGGGETYDRLKEINPDIKVLLSSGYSINGQATKILERGCDGFIQKPFNMTNLSQKIRKI